MIPDIDRGETVAVKERGRTDLEATITTVLRPGPDHRATTIGDLVIGLDLATDGMTGNDLVVDMVRH